MRLNLRAFILFVCLFLNSSLSLGFINPMAKMPELIETAQTAVNLSKAVVGGYGMLRTGKVAATFARPVGFMTKMLDKFIKPLHKDLAVIRPNGIDWQNLTIRSFYGGLSALAALVSGKISYDGLKGFLPGIISLKKKLS